ncbi:TPA: hypothetical protein RQK24_003777 [Vibrio vulnificus]|nr:hypothetical protein [Vibrio vulnificus]
MSVNKTPEQKSIEDMANSAKQSTAPGDAIKVRLSAAREMAEESRKVIAVTRIHSGREHLLSEANAEVYDALMGDKPQEVNGRLYSQHAISKSLKAMNSFKGSTADAMDEAIQMRNSLQDSIDDTLRQLELLKTPESPEDLENTLHYISQKTGVTVSGVKKLSAAIKHQKILEAFEKVGLTPPATCSPQSDRETNEKKIEFLSKQSGASKIQAGLMKKSFG